MAGRNFKAIGFDFDNTLIDSAPAMASALNGALAEMGHGDAGIRSEQVLQRSPLSLLRDHSTSKRAQAQYWSRLTRSLALPGVFFPGIKEMIDATSRALPLGILTSLPAGIVSGALRAHALEKRFGALLGYHDVQFRKPNPEGVTKLARSLGVKTSNLLYVGDRAEDMMAGRSAGAATGAAGWARGDRNPALARAPDFVFQEPGEIRRLVESRSS